jgi:hypothetical protein
MIKPAVDVIQKRIFMVVKEVALPEDFLLRLRADECPTYRAIQVQGNHIK